MIRDRIKHYIMQNKLIKPGDLVIVGVSGGPDSMALLHILYELAGFLEFKLAVAHLNHALREAADAEESLVKEYCQRLGIDFYSQTIDVAGLARKQKLSLEEAGRNARYRFFRELQDRIGAERIATAHHLDDTAETVLHHLLRGSGIKGLRGIMPVYGSLIRPLLAVSKQELLQYVEKHNLEYCLDQSNNDPYYLRNRIRNGLIPYLEKEFNPQIVGKLNQLAVIARAENEVLDQEVQKLWPGILLEEQADRVVLNNQAFSLLHRAYQRRLVLQAFAQLSSEPGWSLDDVEKVLELGNKEGSALTLQLKNKVLINKSYDKIILTTRQPVRVEFNYKIEVPGRLEVPAIGKVYIFSLEKMENFSPQSESVCLDYERLPSTLYLRSRQAGDIFRPFGMAGTKKLKKLFIDLKIPYFERDRVALLAGDNQDILAVLGIGISRGAAVNSTSQTILRIDCEPI